MHRATLPLLTPLPRLTRKSPMTFGAVAMAHLGLLMALMALRVIPTPMPPEDLVVRLINLSPAQPMAPAEPLPVKRHDSPPTSKPLPLPAEVAAPAAPTPLPVAEAPSPVPAPAAAVAREPSPAAITAAAPAPTAPPATPTAPRFDADYLDNPAPSYPPLSRKAGEEGRVVLRVFVEPNGLPSRVEVRTSSGFERLDKAALAAVGRWKFVPAHLGAEAVGAWVLVPLVFSLKA